MCDIYIRKWLHLSLHKSERKNHLENYDVILTKLIY